MRTHENNAGMTPGRMLAAALFVAAGSLHLIAPQAYLKIMPPYLPAPRALVAISGICEVAGGVGLLIPSTRRAAGWGLLALLLAVWPANLHMALDHERWPAIPPWLLWARLPLQLPLMSWVWRYTRA